MQISRRTLSQDLTCSTQCIKHKLRTQEKVTGPERQSPESWFPFTGFLHWGLPSGRAITGKSEFLGKWICAERGRKVCVCGRTKAFLSGAQRAAEGSQQ